MAPTVPGEVKLWDVQTGKEMYTLKGHSSIVTSACYSPDGLHLAAFSADGKVMEWDTASGQATRTFEGAGKGEGLVCFSPDGKFLAGASRTGNGAGGTVKVWDANSGQEMHSLKFTGFPRTLCYSPDGSRLAVASDGLVLKGGVLPGEVMVWDTRTGQQVVGIKDLHNGFSSVCFNADGNRIATSSDGYFDQGKFVAGEVKVSNAHTGEKLILLCGHAQFAERVWFTPDAKRIISRGAHGMAIVWDAATGQTLLTVHESGGVIPVCLSRDGERLATGSNQGLKLSVPRTLAEGQARNPF